jgi:hypothetical protein
MDLNFHWITSLEHTYIPRLGVQVVQVTSQPKISYDRSDDLLESITILVLACF